MRREMINLRMQGLQILFQPSAEVASVSSRTDVFSFSFSCPWFAVDATSFHQVSF